MCFLALVFVLCCMLFFCDVFPSSLYCAISSLIVLESPSSVFPFIPLLRGFLMPSVCRSAYQLLRRYGALHGTELHLEKSLFGYLRNFSFSSFFSPEASTAAVTPGFCYNTAEGPCPSLPCGTDTLQSSPSLPRSAGTESNERTSSPEFDISSDPVVSSPSASEDVIKKEQEAEERLRAGKDVDWDVELGLWRKFNREVSPEAWEKILRTGGDRVPQREEEDFRRLSSRRASSTDGDRKKKARLGRLRIEEEAEEEEEKKEADEGEEARFQQGRTGSHGAKARDPKEGEGKEQRGGSRERRKQQSPANQQGRQGGKGGGRDAKEKHAKKGVGPGKPGNPQQAMKKAARRQAEAGKGQEGGPRGRPEGGGETRRSSKSTAPGTPKCKTDSGGRPARTSKEGGMMKKKAVTDDQRRTQAAKGTSNSAAKKPGPSGPAGSGREIATAVRKVKEGGGKDGGGGARTKAGAGPASPPPGKKKAVGSPSAEDGRVAKKPPGPPGQKKVLSAPAKPSAKKPSQAVA